jgi:hypothetical protein
MMLLPEHLTTGYRVAQIRMFFQLPLSANHPLSRVPLAYVHWFTRPVARLDEYVHMYVVKRLRRHDGRPVDGIIEMASIFRFVQLIPKFPNNSRTVGNLTPDDFMERSSTFVVNSFADIETYQAVY